MFTLFDLKTPQNGIPRVFHLCGLMCFPMKQDVGGETLLGRDLNMNQRWQQNVDVRTNGNKAVHDGRQEALLF